MPQIRIYCFQHAKFKEHLIGLSFRWNTLKSFYGKGFETVEDMDKYLTKHGALLKYIEGEINADPWFTFHR